MHLTSSSFADLQLYKCMRDMAIGKNSVTFFEPIDNISIKMFFFLLSSKIYDPLFLHNLLHCCNLSDLLNILFLVLSSSLILLRVSNIAKCSCLSQLLSVHLEVPFFNFNCNNVIRFCFWLFQYACRKSITDFFQ
jgi:hypothetical protein